jgi:hypothetical protein
VTATIKCSSLDGSYEGFSVPSGGLDAALAPTSVQYDAKKAARLLQPILTCPIDWTLIAQQYDQMVRYATALRIGTATAADILRPRVAFRRIPAGDEPRRVVRGVAQWCFYARRMRIGGIRRKHAGISAWMSAAR